MKSKNGASAIVVVLLLLVVVGIVGVGYYAYSQNVATTDLGTVGACPDSSATVKWASDNLLNASSLASAVTSCKQSLDKGVTYGDAVTNTTSYPTGSKLQCLSTGASFLNVVNDFDVPCGGGNLIVKGYGTSAPTLKMQDDDGNAMTDADDSVQNVSKVTSGSTSITLRVLGKSDQSTGDMLVVLKSNVGNETSTFQLSGADCSNTYVPSFSVSPELVGYAGSGVGTLGACKVSALKDGASGTYDLTINAKSGANILNATLNLSVFGQQAFEDTDGSFKVGIEDSSGSKQYAWAQSFTFYVDKA